ncbi:Transcriptional regulatory protein DegU [Sulfitobacter sp. THAF37]|uniref:response regulator n=1 Tax=Sulfitobacter sp. THAF37 TaxID=2587855 RepID=UPI00126872E7|nr:response regulator transcription factor [Sulfitobacter sp. THAF37]QFT59953.1 Transcriptional regulatory protein DegU [Sulfitobacter sp. THAF37]
MTAYSSATTRPASPTKSSNWALIVDDHPLFCDALELTLRSVTEYTDVRTANSLSGALDEIERSAPPDLVLLDLNLPDVSGLDGLLRLRRQAGGAHVVIVTSVTDNAVISGAIAAGASGFVPKHSRRETFRDAIAAINAGQVYTPSGFVAGEAAAAETENLRRLRSLTKQQARILELVCAGKLNKQIAYDLSIAETTVKAHVTAIMRKLGVQSRTQAVLVAHEASFTSPLPKDE